MNGVQDHESNIVGIVGQSLTELYFLANLYPPGFDADAVTSIIAKFSYGTNEPWITTYGAEVWLTRMDRSPDGTFFAVSMDGELHISRGGISRVLDLGVPTGLNDVWVASDSEAFTVGLNGERVRILNNNFEVVRDPANRRLTAVRGSVRNNVVAVGNEGVIHRYDGERWSELDSPTNYNLLAVLVRSESEIYIAGTDGILFRGDGQRWERLSAPASSNITSLAWFGDTLYACLRPGGICVLKSDGLEPLKSLDVTYLRTITDHLFAVGGTLVARYNGSGWRGGKLEI
jgi:hypothetical protein